MKNYYCLILNNCLTTGSHYVSNGIKCTMLPEIIVKNVKDLSTINEDFMELDDTITVNEDGYTVSCSFPVIGELIDDKMYDVVTGKVIECYDINTDNTVLSYRDKIPAYDPMVELILSLLDEESTKKYADKLATISVSKPRLHSEKNELYFAMLANSGKNPIKIVVENTTEGLVDTFTKEVIYPSKEDTITSHLTIEAIKDIDKKTAKRYRKFIINNGIDDYFNTISEARQNSIAKYNTFVSSTRYESKPKLKVK